MCVVVGECCNVQSRSHETAAAQHNKSHSAQLFLSISLPSRPKARPHPGKVEDVIYNFTRIPERETDKLLSAVYSLLILCSHPTTTFLFPGQNRYKRLQIILLLSCCSSSSIRAVINKQNCDSVAKVLLLVVFFSFFSYYGGG